MCKTICPKRKFWDNEKLANYGTLYLQSQYDSCFRSLFQGTLLTTENDVIVLDGDQATGARFGTSLTRIGDVNDDGYEGKLLLLFLW